MRSFPIFVLPILCMACSPAPWPSDVRVIALQLPYDFAYRQLESGVRRCAAPPRQRVDGQIFPTVAYAQITAYNVYGTHEKPEFMALLSPQFDTTRMKLNIIGPKNRAAMAAWAVYWAQGGQSCPEP